MFDVEAIEAEYFNISEYSFLDKTTNKRIRGYEILSLKS